MVFLIILRSLFFFLTCYIFNFQCS
jgi:hypothetical protein